MLLFKAHATYATSSKQGFTNLSVHRYHGHHPPLWIYMIRLKQKSKLSYAHILYFTHTHACVHAHTHTHTHTHIHPLRFFCSLPPHSPPLPDSLPDDLKDLLLKLLDKDQKKRITIAEIREHPWILKTSRPLPTKEENCNVEISVSEEDMEQAFKTYHTPIHILVSVHYFLRT